MKITGHDEGPKSYRWAVREFGYARAVHSGQRPEGQAQGMHAMLAEKFILLIEALRTRTYPDGGPIVVSTSPHVPVKLPTSNGK